MSQSARSTFVSAVFGEHALASHTDMAAFECSLERFRSGLLSQVPEHMRIYFDSRFQNITHIMLLIFSTVTTELHFLCCYVVCIKSVRLSVAALAIDKAGPI